MNCQREEKLMNKSDDKSDVKDDEEVVRRYLI